MRLIETWRRKRNLHYVVESANRFGLRRRKIDLFALITTEKQKRQTEWRRGLDSNSWLRFAGRWRFIGRQSAYFACLQETESAKPENRTDCTVQDRHCETKG
jgi:hypothetical protein